MQLTRATGALLVCVMALGASHAALITAGRMAPSALLSLRNVASRRSCHLAGAGALRMRGGGGGIHSIVAREVLDSRGNPTVEVDLTTDIGTFRSAVPSGFCLFIKSLQTKIMF